MVPFVITAEAAFIIALLADVGAAGADRRRDRATNFID